MEKSNKIIVGIVGEMASGKTTVTSYLKEKYGAVSFRFSDPLRDMLDRLYLEHSREHMQHLSTALRQVFGDDLLSKVIAHDVAHATDPLIITEGIRRPSDVTYLRELPGFHLLALRVDERVRFERIRVRSENPDDQTKTWEKFQAEGRQEAEQKIKDIAAQADDIIDNNGSMEQLFAQIERILVEIKGK